MSQNKFPPDVPRIYLLEVVVMPNREIICAGRSLGWAGPEGRGIPEKFLKEVSDDR